MNSATDTPNESQRVFYYFEILPSLPRNYEYSRAFIIYELYDLMREIEE